MARPINLVAGYHDGLFDTELLRKLSRRFLADVEFDTVVGTGLSGVLALPIIAEEFGVNTLAIRKPDDKSNHSSSRFSGFLGEKFLIVDDFVSTGATIRRVLGEISGEYKKQRAWDLEDDWTHKAGPEDWMTRCVGFYGYSTAWGHRDSSDEEVQAARKTPYMSMSKLWDERFIKFDQAERFGLAEPEPVRVPTSFLVGGGGGGGRVGGELASPVYSNLETSLA